MSEIEAEVEAPVETTEAVVETTEAVVETTEAVVETGASTSASISDNVYQILKGLKNIDFLKSFNFGHLA